MRLATGGFISEISSRNTQLVNFSCIFAYVNILQGFLKCKTFKSSLFYGEDALNSVFARTDNDHLVCGIKCLNVNDSSCS